MASQRPASSAYRIAATRFIVLVVGCAISLAAFYWAGQRENQRVREVLNLRSDWRADDFAHKITQEVAPVQALADFVASQASVNEGEFSAFASHVRGDAPVETLAWSRLVTDGERDAFVKEMRGGRDPGFDIRERDANGRIVPAPRRGEYLAVEFLQSFDRRPTFLGYDLLSEPLRGNTAERSRDTGTAIVTPPLASPVMGDTVPSLLFLFPAYRKGLAPQTPRQRHDTLLGLAVGLYRADDMAKFAIKDTPKIVETLTITVRSSSAGSQGMRWILGASAPIQVDVLEAPMPGPKSGWLRIERSFERLGSHWTLDFDFPPQVVDGLTSRAHWSFLILGIPLSLLIAEALSRGLRRRMEIERLVVERTEQLRAISHELDAIIEASPIAIVCLDGARNVTLWNHAAEEMFGHVAGEVMGLPVRLVPAEGEREFGAWLDRIAAGEILRGMDAHCMRKDGALIDASLSGGRLVGGSGGSAGIVLAIQDRTASNLLQKQLAQSQKMESIGQLTGGLAHDFNNILGAVIGNFELLEDFIPAHSPASEFRSAGLHAALSAADLVKRLLAFSRRQSLRPAAVDIREVLSNMQPLIRHSIGGRIKVETAVSDDVWHAIADVSQLENAILNLAINARDAMPQGGALQIEAHNTTVDPEDLPASVELAPGDYVTIAVSDTGSGMSPETQARAFEPFFTTKGPHAGSGLGLSMVYGTMRQLGGTATIYSETGVGTTVRLYLPRALGKDDRSRSKDANATAVSAGGRECVLLVEDNEELRILATKMLDEMGYRVLVAEDAAAALHHVQQGHRFDVLFTDIVMPGERDGIALARTLRATDADLPVLLASGFTSPEELVQEDIDALGAGFITKPYRRSDLANALRKVLARRTDRLSAIGSRR